MISPVATAASGPGRWTQRFFLPSSLTLATAPVPADPRVRLVELPEETVAALRLSGLAGAHVLEAKKRALGDALARSASRPRAEPYPLFGDPPFTLPPLRRNEVAIAVEPSAP